jgi:hypothetical protein
MSRDLTAILLRPPSAGLVDAGGAPLSAGEPISTEWIESVVRSRGRPAILRVAPLPSVGLVQVEVSDVADGLPTEDPELVAALSSRGAATFLHVNHEAGQAILHGFDRGAAGEGFVGVPGAEFSEKLRARLGCDLEALHGADDQSRAGIGVVASRTAAVLPGRSIALPIGMPSALGSFAFHDRAVGQTEEAERCAFFAFDRPLVPAILATPGAELAKVIEGVMGAQRATPGDDMLDGILAALRELGDQPLRTVGPGARATAMRAIELLVLSSGRVFAGGDRVDFWDQRVLPLLSLEDINPVIDEDDLESLEASASVLHALVEVVPSSAPPGGIGSVLEGLSDRELAPLVPQLAEADSYAGSILGLQPERLTARLRELDGERLSRAVERLEAVWYQRKTGQPPEGEAFDAFRKQRAESGQADVDRVLRHLSELRIVLEVAAVNDLVVAVSFYG